MKENKIIFLILILISFKINAQKDDDKTDNLVDLVNPLVGSDSAFELSNGNTYPAIATPWGMNFWTPKHKRIN